MLFLHIIDTIVWTDLLNIFQNLQLKLFIAIQLKPSTKGEIPKNITYYNNPKLKFSEKILFCLNKVKTPLVALSADDDFLEIESLIKGNAF